MRMKSLNTDKTPAPSVAEVLSDPSASHWLKNALRAALSRDPVDAANDAEVLARVLDARVRDLLREVEGSPGP